MGITCLNMTLWCLTYFIHNVNFSDKPRSGCLCTVYDESAGVKLYDISMRNQLNEF